MLNLMKIGFMFLAISLLLFACPKAIKVPETEEEIQKAVVTNNTVALGRWLENGGNPNQLIGGNSLLYIATGPKGGYEITKLLIENGAAINVGVGKFTPLMNAASWTNLKTVQLLLDHGADKNLMNTRGETAYELIGDCGDCPEMETLKKLLKTEVSGNIYEGTFSYMADANLFVSCDKKTSMPIEMEGEYLTLEKAYTSLVEGGTEVYVRLKGYPQAAPAMEGDRKITVLVVTAILEINKDKNCD